MPEYDRISLSIKTLLDTNARVDQRDDAAMDLGRYDDDQVLNALITVAFNPYEDMSILDVCGGSIAAILIRRNEFRKDIIQKLCDPARHEAESYIKNDKPEWKLD